jgi:hypothetical protein
VVSAPLVGTLNSLSSVSAWLDLPYKLTDTNQMLLSGRCVLPFVTLRKLGGRVLGMSVSGDDFTFRLLTLFDLGVAGTTPDASASGKRRPIQSKSMCWRI